MVFMAAKSVLISFNQILASSILLLSVPASANRFSILTRVSLTCCSKSLVPRLAMIPTIPDSLTTPLCIKTPLDLGSSVWSLTILDFWECLKRQYKAMPPRPPATPPRKLVITTLLSILIIKQRFST